MMQRFPRGPEREDLIMRPSMTNEWVIEVKSLANAGWIHVMTPPVAAESGNRE